MSNWKYLSEDVDEFVDMEAANRATEKAFGKTWKKNKKKNKIEFTGKRLFDSRISKHFDKPMIVAGEGLSLDRDIKFLKKTNIPILSIQQSLPILLRDRANVKYCVQVDGDKRDVQFITDDVSDVTLLTSYSVAPEFIDAWDGDVLYFETGKKLLPLGSSFNLAVEIADLVFGADPIILVGADMCWINGQQFCWDGNAKDVTYDEIMEIINIKTKEEVKTSYQFLLYKKSLEWYISKRKNTEFINTGLPSILEGIKTMTLTQAIKEFNNE